MISVWLKLAHISALVLWCGGLFALPGLLRLRPAGDGPALWEAHRFARGVYIGVVSPAAFVAVSTGTVLVFVEEVFSVWFAFKLAAVAALVGVHARIGYLVPETFKPGRSFPLWRQVGLQGAIATAALAILWLVLSEPDLDFRLLPDWFFEPGGLHSASERLIPIP